MESSEQQQEHQPVPTTGEGWPEELQPEIARLFETSASDVEGTRRLGALAFNEAPEQIEIIKGIVRDLTLEPWGELAPGFRDQLLGYLQNLNGTLEEMRALSSDNPEASNARNALIERMNGLVGWFAGEARPKAMRALIDRRNRETQTRIDNETLAEAEHRLNAIATNLTALESKNEEINRELTARSDLVSSERKDAGESAGETLASAFRGKSKDHKDLAEKWLKALVGMSAFAAISAVVTFVILHNTGDNKSPDFAELGLGLFILGLLAFGVRVCAQNYRVNRHLEASAWGKATVLSTFQRLFSSVEEGDVRSTIALALAQEVFRAEDTGLVDGSGDQVTLVERAVSTRIPASSSQTNV